MLHATCSLLSEDPSSKCLDVSKYLEIAAEARKIKVDHCQELEKQWGEEQWGTRARIWEMGKRLEALTSAGEINIVRGRSEKDKITGRVYKKE